MAGRARERHTEERWDLRVEPQAQQRPLDDDYDDEDVLDEEDGEVALDVHLDDAVFCRHAVRPAAGNGVCTIIQPCVVRWQLHEVLADMLCHEWDPNPLSRHRHGQQWPKQ